MNENLIKMNLQMFAEGVEDSKSTADENGVRGDFRDGGSSGAYDDGANVGKTFTQEEVNHMMAKEKREGKASGINSMLKKSGYENEDDLIAALTAYKEILDKDKSAEEKAKDALADLEIQKQDFEKQKSAFETKVKVLANDVKPDLVDDILPLVFAKVTEENDIEKVLKDMKDRPEFSGFFNNVSNGTGSTRQGSQGGNNEPAIKGMGARLAANVKQETKKSNYF